MAPKKDAVLGDAHKLFEQYSTRNGTHTGKLIKKQLVALMETMQKEQRFVFVSKAELTSWVDERFKEFDVDGNKSLSLEEFVKFYRGFLCRSPEQVAAQLKKTQNEMERCFLMFDKNHDFSLQRAELIQFMHSRVPSGLAVDDQQLSDLLQEMDFFGIYDVNKDGEIDYSEFCEGFNALVDKLNELIAKLRRQEMEGAGFRGMLKQQTSFSGTDDVDMEELEEQCKDRFTGKTWYAFVKELGGQREGGNVLERARRAGKIPLLLKHPDQGAHACIPDLVRTSFSCSHAPRVMAPRCPHSDGQPLAVLQPVGDRNGARFAGIVHGGCRADSQRGRGDRHGSEGRRQRVERRQDPGAPPQRYCARLDVRLEQADSPSCFVLGGGVPRAGYAASAASKARALCFCQRLSRPAALAPNPPTSILCVLISIIVGAGPVHKDAAALLRPSDGPIDVFKIQVGEPPRPASRHLASPRVTSPRFASVRFRSRPRSPSYRSSAASSQEGYQLCFLSAFDMNNWKRYLRGKLPMGELQPIQVCETLMQVAQVMKEGLPKDTMDEDLDKMDRLADML